MSRIPMSNGVFLQWIKTSCPSGTGTFHLRCLVFCTLFFWPLCCLFFFDIRIAITTLVSSNSSYTTACSLYKYVVQRHSLLSTDIFNTKHFAIILLPIKAWTKRVLICSFKTNYVKSESQLLSLFLLNKIFNIRLRTLIYLVIAYLGFRLSIKLYLNDKNS
jgi:hypothetical protein